MVHEANEHKINNNMPVFLQEKSYENGQSPVVTSQQKNSLSWLK